MEQTQQEIYQTFMHMCQECHTALIESMLKRNAWLADYNECMLLRVCETNRVDVVHLLLQYKAMPNLSCELHPLQYAMDQGYGDICILLLDYGANPYHLGGTSHTTLHEHALEVAGSSSPPNVKRAAMDVLMAVAVQGIWTDVNQKNSADRVVLYEKLFPHVSPHKRAMWLIDSVHDEIMCEVEWLLRMPVDLDCRMYSDTKTALETACSNRNVPLMEALLLKKANPHLRNHQDQTVLHQAFLMQDMNVCKFLCEHNGWEKDVHQIALHDAFDRSDEWALQFLVMSKQVELADYAQRFHDIPNIRHIIGHDEQEIIRNLYKEYLESSQTLPDRLDQSLEY